MGIAADGPNWQAAASNNNKQSNKQHQSVVVPIDKMLENAIKIFFRIIHHLKHNRTKGIFGYKAKKCCNAMNSS